MASTERGTTRSCRGQRPVHDLKFALCFVERRRPVRYLGRKSLESGRPRVWAYTPQAASRGCPDQEPRLGTMRNPMSMTVRRLRMVFCSGTEKPRTKEQANQEDQRSLTSMEPRNKHTPESNHGEVEELNHDASTCMRGSRWNNLALHEKPSETVVTNSFGHANYAAKRVPSFQRCSGMQSSVSWP